MWTTILVPIHRDGWRFVLAFALASLLLWSLYTPLGLIGAAATLWCACFFRDPPRVTPARSGLLVSPADGIVQTAEAAAAPPELGLDAKPRTRISVFMNVLDVHVNRIPADATVTALVYRRGKFFNASLDKASEFNERQAVRLRLPDGRDLGLVQIAGLVARRIRCDLAVGQRVRAGERFGLIRFGSRVDVYLPEGVAPLVVADQIAVAGETVIADLNSPEPPRIGEKR